MDSFYPQPLMIPRRVSASQSHSRFARTLRSGKNALVMFYSKNCVLCRSLQPLVDEVAKREDDWLEVARICTDAQDEWVPEMLHYGIEYVPCFVMLVPGGDAIMKSGPPKNSAIVSKSLVAMIEYSKLKE
ncbi:hypothetical protein BSKO_00177 [Bryopsis sp. KO-2023]|nr:hypothetical protein BSKO_00177 [Bryopsis sp. KO-2023]